MLENKYATIKFPGIDNELGAINFLELNSEIPFEIRRVYYIWNVPPNVTRGHHAHKELQQLIVPISGSFTLTLDDGFESKALRLSECTKGVHIKPMVWRTLSDFSKNAVCLVLASEIYLESDYYRDYEIFKAACRVLR